MLLAAMDMGNNNNNNNNKPNASNKWWLMIMMMMMMETSSEWDHLCQWENDRGGVGEKERKDKGTNLTEKKETNAEQLILPHSCYKQQSITQYVKM